MKEKLVSLFFCFVYLVGSYLYADGGAILSTAAGLIVPLTCIWFAEELGSFVGPSGRSLWRGRYPTLMVKVVGWLLLLLLPLMLMLI